MNQYKTRLKVITHNKSKEDKYKNDPYAFGKLPKAYGPFTILN